MGGLMVVIGGLMVVDLSPPQAAGAAAQDLVSGFLLDAYKHVDAVTGLATRDLGPTFASWVAASVASLL